MTSTTDRISPEFVAKPSPQQQVLMHALSEWLNTDDIPVAWDEAEDLVGAMMRAARFGDSTCDGPDGTLRGHDPEVVNYPVALRLDRGAWEAFYRCRECGHRYRCGWSDNQ